MAGAAAALDWLTLAELCDVVYVLLRDRIERHVLAERQTAAVLIAAGAKNITLPDLAEQWRVLDDELAADEPASNPDRDALRRAVGLSVSR